jgi:hypothetical protein
MVAVNHTFVSTVPDGTDATVLRPSNWNADHTLSMATSRILGRTTGGSGTVEEIAVAGTLTLATGTLTGTGASTGKAIAMSIVFGG